MSKNTVIIFFVIALFAAIGISAYLLGKSQNRQPTPIQVNSVPVTIIPTQSVSPAPQESEITDSDETGILEGSIGFPSEIIPEDMEICAENQATNQVYCTTDQINDQKYTYGVGYKLEVPIGSYRVYATVDAFGEYKAYYNEFVECGLSANCTDTTVVTVNVNEGQTTSGVDPQDWYHYTPQL